MPTCQGRYAPPKAVALLLPQARTILKYALFYHGTGHLQKILNIAGYPEADKPQGSGDRVHGISSEIAGRNYVVRSAPSNTSDYFPNVLTTPACPQTILQTADTPVPSHAQA